MRFRLGPSGCVQQFVLFLEFQEGKEREENEQSCEIVQLEAMYLQEEIGNKTKEINRNSIITFSRVSVLVLLSSRALHRAAFPIVPE